MSVFTVLWLDCNGCKAERFIPDAPQGKAPALRELAAAAGWAVNHRSMGEDYGPRCAAALGVGRVMARGDCAGCGVNRPLTKQAVMQAHRRYLDGRKVECPGSGNPPTRVTLQAPAAAGAHGWKSLL